MTLDFTDEYEKELSFQPEAVAKKVIEASLDMVECPYEAEVSLLLTGNKEIHQMNLEFRQIDSPTDVLSFPMAEYETPGNFSSLEDTQPDCFHPETGELILGDIVISVDKMTAQALEYGHSEKREFAFLVAHSMLHLMGYDHMEEDERTVMEEMQRKILDGVGITR